MYTNSDFEQKVMGNKDKTRDGDAADRDHSSHANRDHSRDQEESRDAALARTIAEAVALQTKSIVEMFSKQKAEETQSIVEMFSKQRQKRHSPSQKHSQGRWTRQMRSMRSF